MINKLIEKIRKTNAPIVVGLDRNSGRHWKVLQRQSGSLTKASLMQLMI